MNQWLMAHYQGEWYGDHHDWQVPAFAKNFLIFTVVRSPYQRAVSGYFAMPRNSSILKDSEIIEELVKWIVTRVLTGEAVVIPPQVVNPYSPYRGFF